MLSEAVLSDYRIHSIVFRAGVVVPVEMDLPLDICYEASPIDFQKISSHVSPEGILVVLHFPENDRFAQVELPDFEVKGPAFILAGIQDPGNLGTIMRTSDWFGMPTLICGPGTADCFNPKVLRSSMGSLFRIQIIYISELEEWLATHAHDVWCADMDGLPLDQVDIPTKPFVLLGNEAAGVSEAIRRIPALQKVTIPRFGKSESLNAASAAAVFAWNMRPRK